MKQIVFLFLSSCLFLSVSAQKKVYTIQADSVKITNCDSAELIIENHTQDVKGFLYNTGNGRTIFKKGVIKVNDSMYIIGADTLRSNAWLQGGNRWGKTGILGTLDNYPLDIYTNNVARSRFTTSGRLLLGTTTENGSTLQVNGSLFGDYFTNFAGSTSSGAVRLRYTPDGTYLGLYYSGSLTKRAHLATGSDTRPLYFEDSVGISFLNTPRVTIGSEYGLNDAMFSIYRKKTSPYDVMSAGHITTGTSGDSLVDDLHIKANGNMIVGASADNGNKFQVSGNSSMDGTLAITGTKNLADGAWHSRFQPTLNTTLSPYAGYYGMLFAPTINFNGPNQQAYPVAIVPTFNTTSGAQGTDGVSSALYIKSSLSGLRIDQNSSIDGANTGQPLFLYQGTTANKEMAYLYRNANPSSKPFIRINDNRVAADQANMVPVVYNTINAPHAGGGISLEMGRVSYNTEASIQMIYETTPDMATNVNTSMSFITASSGVKQSAVYINGPNIGMGTKTPSAQLHTTGTVRFAGLTNDSTQTRVIVSDATGKLYYRSASSLASEGILYSSLAVNGPIKAKSLQLAPAGSWPDFVFDSSYHLPTLKEVETDLRSDHHLSGFPSAAEVGINGIDVGAHQAALLKKIEELTLYAIEQDKKIEAQHEDAVELKKLIEAQVAELQLLKKEVAGMKKQVKTIK